MPLGTAALLGINAGIPLLKAGVKGLGWGKNAPSEYEEQLFRMADIFGSEASVPLTESRAFKSGMSILNEQDDKNRRAINNQSAVTGATDEAKLATMQGSNENLNRGIQRLLEFASRQKDRDRQLQLSYLGAGEQARMGRKQQDAANYSAIFDPLQQAAGAFTMAELLYGGGGGYSGGGTTGGSPLIASAPPRPRVDYGSVFG